LILILAVGVSLRLYGLNWDGGHWLHPDERQIFFVVEDLGWPDSLAEALSPDSPLNPHFFAYGSLPIYLLRLVVALLKPFWPTFHLGDHLHLVARPLAVLADLCTIYLTYRLARILLPPPRSEGAVRWGALLAAAFVSLAIIHVQQAHFYTVDPLLTFFVMLTLNLAADVGRGGGRARQVALGVSLGMALATKISAAPLLFVVFVAYYERCPATGSQSPARRFLAVLRHMLLPLAVAGAVFVIMQPYALIDGSTFLDDTLRESQIARGTFDVPYTIQYTGTLPFLYSMWQTAFWGLALPLGLIAWAALAASLSRWLRRGPWNDALPLAWVGPYLAITGLLYAKHLRYMLPLVPVLCILAARLLVGPGQEGANDSGRRVSSIRDWGARNWPALAASLLVVSVSLAYALLFARIYASPHSWVTASEWIYRNVPERSTVAVEYWDRALPLPVLTEGVRHSPKVYEQAVLSLYEEPDDAAKWESLAAELSASDYLILASRRLYGSIPRSPDRYPFTTRYYDLLFAGDLGFDLAVEFTRGPTWLNPRVPPLPDPAPALFRPDESFVVYDHPRALVFRNVEHLPPEEIFRRLQ
jgi:4-amino-4-deoxy-L-arabinose transferase-like glycosyltransferase